jgi:WD40 repeat protein
MDLKSETRPMPAITHPTAVRAVLPLQTTPLAEPYLLTGSGDVIRAYDISSPDEPELLGELDAHWHDIITLRLWLRKSPVEGELNKSKIEPWIVSASLDGTLRKWKLLGTNSINHSCDVYLQCLYLIQSFCTPRNL